MGTTPAGEIALQALIFVALVTSATMFDCIAKSLKLFNHE